MHLLLLLLLSETLELRHEWVRLWRYVGALRPRTSCSANRSRLLLWSGGDYVCKFSKKNPDSRFLSRKTERFRQAVRGMQTNEVKFEHARGEQKAEPSLHYIAHRPHRPTGVEAGWVFAAGRCQK